VAQPRASTSQMIVCKQLVARFETENGEREIGLRLLRRVRSQIRRTCGAAGAQGSMVLAPGPNAQTEASRSSALVASAAANEMIALASPQNGRSGRNSGDAPRGPGSRIDAGSAG